MLAISVDVKLRKRSQLSAPAEETEVAIGFCVDARAFVLTAAVFGNTLKAVEMLREE